MENVTLKDFHDLHSHNCYKNPMNPSCINLILTNSPKYFQNFNVFETGPSDVHRMVVTMTKTSYRKLDPKILNYKKYNDFSKTVFSLIYILIVVLGQLLPDNCPLDNCPPDNFPLDNCPLDNCSRTIAPQDN